MSEVRELLMNSAGRLFAELAERKVWQAVESGEWPADAWSALEEMGLPHALVPEDAGGSGLEPSDALGLAELAGYHAVPLPLVETLIGGRVLSAAGLPAGLQVSEGPLSLATPNTEQPLQLRRAGDGWSVSGELVRIPWGRHVGHVVAVAEAGDGSYLVCVPTVGLSWRQDIDIAGEPRDSATLDQVALAASAVAPVPADQPNLMEWGALARSLQMAGAMRRALEQSVQYANERVQFGRPIGKFQAVQQNLAAMAGQVAAAGAAADTAAQSVDTPHYGFGIAVAKARVGEAAGQAAAIAHQVHGAMGFTREHTLHLSTRRLWSWREEFGHEPYWQRQIGLAVAARGSDGLWPYLTAL